MDNFDTLVEKATALEKAEEQKKKQEWEYVKQLELVCKHGLVTKPLLHWWDARKLCPKDRTKLTFTRWVVPTGTCSTGLIYHYQCPICDYEWAT